MIVFILKNKFPRFRGGNFAKEGLILEGATEHNNTLFEDIALSGSLH